MPKSKEVDAWLAKYDNPQKPVLQKVREILLGADRRLGECIKWQSPTFVYGTNLASFNPRSKKHVSLLFHTGAKIPGKFPRLEGGAGTARYMKFESQGDAAAAKDELRAIVAAWIELQDGSGARATPAKKKIAPKTAAETPAAKRKKAKRPAAKKKPSKTRRAR